MKKKLRDCTYGEIGRFCKKKHEKWFNCEDCPLVVFDKGGWYHLACERCPECLTENELDIEIDIPEEEK